MYLYGRRVLSDFDALLLPGGVMNPDTLRIIPAAIAFIKTFVDGGKPIASICHGPWTLIEPGATRGAADDVLAFPEVRSLQCRCQLGR